MGTRHLIAVQLDGEYKIAQYGQWDGQPSGQGATVLEFLHNWDRPLFESKLRAAFWLTQEEGEAIDAKIKADGIENSWQTIWPELTRDTGARILELVQTAAPGIKLQNDISFAADSLFCEWAYVIDLDTNTLEVYKGFQKGPPPPSDRFANVKLDDETENRRKGQNKYYPIRKIASYSLDSLPDPQQWDEDFEPNDE